MHPLSQITLIGLSSVTRNSLKTMIPAWLIFYVFLWIDGAIGVLIKNHSLFLILALAIPIALFFITSWLTKYLLDDFMKTNNINSLADFYKVKDQIYAERKKRDRP